MTFRRYDSRFQAGEILAQTVKEENKALYNSMVENPDAFFCFAIPNGGVPVAEGFCSSLKIRYDLIIVRKIKIPYNTEAGFGSVTSDGSVLINQPLLERLELTKKQIEAQVSITKQEIAERLAYYDKDTRSESYYKRLISKKTIFMIDDGLASGFTMLAAIKMLKTYSPNFIHVAVPTAPESTAQKISSNVDAIFCPNIRNVMRFAVADAYKHWYDVSEEEVLELIEQSDYYLGKT